MLPPYAIARDGTTPVRWHPPLVLVLAPATQCTQAQGGFAGGGPRLRLNPRNTPVRADPAPLFAPCPAPLDPVLLFARHDQRTQLECTQVQGGFAGGGPRLRLKCHEMPRCEPTPHLCLHPAPP